jgi:hypothetical protein
MKRRKLERDREIHTFTPEKQQKFSTTDMNLYRFLWFSDSPFKKQKKYHNYALNEDEKA